MSKAIIPEVLEDRFLEKNNNKNLNLTLNKIDKRNYSVNHENFTTHNNITNTTNNINKGGFFRLIFDLVTLPFKIVYKLFSYLYTKYNFKEFILIEMVKNKKNKLRGKILRKCKRLWDTDEIY